MYQQILCLVALNAECKPLVDRAKRLSSSLNAELRLLHVVEYVPLTGTEDAMLTAPISIGDELQKRAELDLHNLAAAAGLAQEQCHVVSGDLVSELRSAMATWNIDLVIVGNHSRRGVSALFDHAEDTVLHRCDCDLLAVHLC